MQETWARILGGEDPLEEEMATHSSILAWRIPWTEEPGGQQSIGSQRVQYDWATNSFLPFCLPLPTFSSPKTMQASFLDLLALFLCVYDDLGWPKPLLTLIIFPCWKYGNRTTSPSIPITLHYLQWCVYTNTPVCIQTHTHTDFWILQHIYVNTG